MHVPIVSEVVVVVIENHCQSSFYLLGKIVDSSTLISIISLLSGVSCRAPPLPYSGDDFVNGSGLSPSLPNF